MDQAETQKALDPTAIAEIAARVKPAQAPLSTYRIQFNAGFTFKDAEEIVPYLATLGIGALYASPIFKATPGSMHGYDITDYNALNPEIGADEEFHSLVAALRRHGLGLILDFVPNHMGIAGGTNAWWLDVLENGQTSAYVNFFDIDWRPLKSELRNKVLIPVLGDHYGVVLERGELRLTYEEGAFTVFYFEQPLPLAPPTYPAILRRAFEELGDQLEPDAHESLEIQSIITAFERLPGNDERDPDRMAERQREQTVAKRRLSDLVRVTPEIAGAVERSVRALNGDPNDPRSFDALDAMLEEQSYRLSFWRTASEEINYRRFFAINDLAAIRQEAPEVFAATHAFLLRLIGEEVVIGVRVDHPDGLWDPAGYFAQLQRAAFLARARNVFASDPPKRVRLFTWESLEPALVAWWEDTQTEERRLPIYVVVEKILEHGEALPTDWAVHGTVGYEFANAVTGLFVDEASRKAFADLYQRFTSGEHHSFADLVYDSKKLIMRVALASEVNVLARVLNRISEHHRHTRDFTLNNLRFAMREIIACFPVYRTYSVCDEGGVADRDRRSIEQAVSAAKRRNPASDPSVFDFVRDVLIRSHDDETDAQRADHCNFRMKFQQLTGPVMAKGLEDTAFYIDNRLTSLNEVGGDPTVFGVSVLEFHRQNAERHRQWPMAMLTSSTHDTKRSEDVRARIDVLSEIPREWRAAINRWARFNRRHKTRVEGVPAPDRNDEYLFYQTLLGVWPLDQETPDDEFIARIEAYMLKAIREAQVHTSWINPNAAYDDATVNFVRATLSAKAASAFLDDFGPFRDRIAEAGIVNGLGQQLLKLTSPGVPDLYQGTEVWDFSLVDPDNRRPVDYDLRQRLLRVAQRRKPGRRLARDLWVRRNDGAIKLYLTQRVLDIRRANRDLFQRGDYIPLETSGQQRDQLCAYARRLDDRELIVVVPRHVASFSKEELLGAEVWGDTQVLLPAVSNVSNVSEGMRYRDVLTGGIVTPDLIDEKAAIAVVDLFSTLPVACLIRLGPDEP